MTNRSPNGNPQADAFRGSVLVVDDNEANREILSARLEQQGHRVTVAENGRHALEVLASQDFDVMLLDIMMPELNGYQVLEQLKINGRLREMPVIMISALNDIESIIRSVELGAEGYVFKPFNNTLLKARVQSALEKKRWRDQEQLYLRQIQEEQAKSESLLLNVLPQAVAERLKNHENPIADYFEEVTVLFADLAGFTETSSSLPPRQIVGWLGEIFSAFDNLAEKHGLEKIKTIGDAYMIVGGVPIPRADHASAVAEMALEMRDTIIAFNARHHVALDMRIGIHSGPVVAGVIGTKKFAYDLWGDTVNVASRMESHGIVGDIQMSVATYLLLKDRYQCEPRGRIEVKGKGEMDVYLLKGKR